MGAGVIATGLFARHQSGKRHTGAFLFLPANRLLGSYSDLCDVCEQPSG